MIFAKKCKIFERWELRLQTPVPPAARGFASRPPASGSWELCPQTHIGLRRLGAPFPNPQTQPPLRISGYAPVQEQLLSKLRHQGSKLAILVGIKKRLSFWIKETIITVRCDGSDSMSLRKYRGKFRYPVFL